MGQQAGLRLLLLSGSLLAHIHGEDVFGIVGENFTFPVKIDQKITEILWTKIDKVAEWEGQNQPMYFTSLRNRGLLHKENGSLTIFNLESDDAGMYKLDYIDSVKKNEVLTFKLVVLDPPSEPKISCNISDDDLVLKCTSEFQKPLNYTWKFSSIPVTYQTQEVVIPKKNVNASEKATCFIKFSQTEKSVEISLAQCFPDKKGGSHHKRNRGLLATFLLIPAVVVLVLLCRKGRTKLRTGSAAQKNSPVHGSGEHQLLFSADSQEQPHSDGAPSSQAVDYENEKPEADKELNKEDSALEDKQMVNKGVNQEGIFKENSSLLAKHADGDGVNEGGSGRDHEDCVESEVIQDAEDGNRELLSNSKEDLKSQTNNCSVDQTTIEEKQ